VCCAGGGARAGEGRAPEARAGHLQAHAPPPPGASGGGGVRCAAGCCIKFVKKCISRGRTPRGRDAWAFVIDIKSYSTKFLCIFQK
jgi:hypothetical protein